MSSTSKAFFKLSLTQQFKRPLFYIIWILFTLIIPANFYLRQQFFSAAGSTDLILLYSFVPYVSIILIPVLCFKTQEQIYENFIPLKNVNKILCRFLVLFVLFAIICISIIPSALFVNLYGSIDWGQLFVSQIFILLYGAACISLCLFFEELILNPIISLLVSVVLLFIFNTAHLLSLYTNCPYFISTISKQLSFAWHFDSASKGIFDTRDFFFFILTACIFLFLTVFTKKIKAGFKIKTKKYFSSFAAFVLILLLLLLNSSRYFLRFDLSQNQTYSLSSYSKKLLKNLNNNLKITYYRSSSLNRLYPQIRDISDYLSSYSQQNINISYVIQDPDKNDKLPELLQNYGINGQQLRNVNTTSTEYKTVYSSIVLEMNGIYATIPFSLSSESLEYDLDRNIKTLITGQKPVINIIMGNGLSLYEDYDYLLVWLNSQGFQINELELNSDFSEKLLNSNGTLYIIGDSNINIEQAISIENYILNEKGNVFFNVNPYSVKIDSDWTMTQNKKTNLIEMLENWGITFTEKIAADISCAQVSFYSDDNQTESLNYSQWINLMPQTNCKQGATIYWATPLVINEDSTIKVNPYLVSSSSAYAFNIDRNSKDKIVETDPFTLKTINTSSFEKTTELLGAQITGPLTGLYNALSCSKSNMIIIPDQYFANSLMCGYIGGQNGDYRNFDLITNILWKLEEEQELAELQSKTSRDTSLFKITDESEFIKNRTFTFVSLFILLPFIILCIFVVIKIKLLKKNRRITIK